MAWKLFGKSKSEEKETIEIKDPVTEEVVEKETEMEPLPEEEPKDQPLAEHHETLQTGTAKKTTTGKKPADQRVWRDVDSIEEKIDNLHITRAKKPVDELDRAVDRILEKDNK